MLKVRLERVSLATWDRAAGLEADPGQDRFGPSVEESLLRWIGESGDVTHEPLLAYPLEDPTTDELPVGFITLLFPANHPDRCIMAGLRIARQRQGHGYGGATLDACIDWIRRLRPSCRVLYLTVHPENKVARGLYERRGFTPAEARVGDQLVYSRPI